MSYTIHHLGQTTFIRQPFKHGFLAFAQNDSPDPRAEARGRSRRIQNDKMLCSSPEGDDRRQPGAGFSIHK